MIGATVLAGLVILALIVTWTRRRPVTEQQSSGDGRRFSGDDLGPDEFPLSVVGESFKNKNGAQRQDIIRRCRPGDPVTLVPEPDNTKDRFAVAVIHRLGQIGYLESGSGRVADEMASGKFQSVTILNIHGGDQSRRSVGVSLRVKKAPPKPKAPRRKTKAVTKG
jgi:hypothetical protein